MSDPKPTAPLTPPTLTAPEPLMAPEPALPVSPDAAGTMVKLDDEATRALDAKVRAFVESVMTLDAQSPDFKRKVDSVHSLGNADIRAAAGVSNRMLERPAAALDNGLFGDKAPIARSLVDLRNTVEDLDPSRQGELLSPRKLLGLIPRGNQVRNYFLKYRSAQAHINAILEALYRGQDELRRDNAAIEQEKVNLWNTMQRLQSYVYLSKKVDAALSARVAEIEQTDPEKARVVKEEMLFYTRQKVTDLLTQLAVSVQGYLALDLVRKNNLELIKGVDRATTTTVSALRTAVIVAQALTNQKLVLDQIGRSTPPPATSSNRPRRCSKISPRAYTSKPRARRSIWRSSKKPSPTPTRRWTPFQTTNFRRSVRCKKPWTRCRRNSSGPKRISTECGVKRSRRLRGS